MAELQEKWVHMVGIGGAGMSGIAQVLKESGLKVTGSDLKLSDTTERLQRMGIIVNEGHSAENLVSGVDTVVFSTAVPLSNPELAEARKRGLNILGRGQMLARLANSRQAVAIAGAHGKTTTTSMIATMLMDCGFNPTFISGGELKVNGCNANFGQGSLFVIEADESDGSFLELFPHIAVITNVEDDHLDHYKTEEKLQQAFAQFLNQITPGGFAVVCSDDAFLRQVTVPEGIKLIRYGTGNDADYSLANWRPVGMGSQYELTTPKGLAGTVELAVPGIHNALNSVAALGVGLELGADFNAIVSSLKVFKGARRRFEIILQEPMAIIDDYAHHPTEIAATIAAARHCNPSRLIAVFQPHRFSRTAQLGNHFGPAFRGADRVFITDVYAAGEKPIEGISGRIIYDSALENGLEASYIPRKEDLAQELAVQVRPGDMVLFMGAGDIWQCARTLAEIIAGDSR